MHTKDCTDQSEDANDDLMNVHDVETVTGCGKGANCGVGKHDHQCPHKNEDRRDGRGRTSVWYNNSDRSDSTSSGESWYSECCDGATGGLTNGISTRVSEPFVKRHGCCCGNCNDCCHGDCGCYGHFDYHDDYGRSGQLLGLGKRSMRTADARRPPLTIIWQNTHHREGPLDSIEESSYLTSKLRFESSRFVDALNYPERSFDKALFFSEFRSKVLSLLGLVDEAVGKLEGLEILHEELYTSRQLLRFQKARNRRLQDDYMRLEMQLTEVNNDYGQLLVECGAKDQTLSRKPSAQNMEKQVLQEKWTQTEQITMVDAGTIFCPSTKTLGTQRERYVKKEVATQVEIIPLDTKMAGTNGRGHSYIAQGIKEEENSSEISQERTLVSGVGKSNSNDATSDVSNPVSSCEGATAKHSTERTATEKEEIHEMSCLPNKIASTSEYRHNSSESDDRPLLSDQTRDLAEERNAEGTSVQSITWPCDHYKRLCLVKFACCEEYYPCHRCHNKNAKCSSKNMKAVNAKFLKCLSCNEIQKFTEKSQHCRKCGIEFAKYFCKFCQHLTGMDDKPYHCSKCGICRVKSDKSFHCDNCGVCLDVQLRGNHVCRADSAHDPCCICFEDAFSGCQILPCGHKVHKDCATLMVANGLRSCPVCRQSFAHRLQLVPKSHK